MLPSTRPTIHVGDLTFAYGASAQPIVEGLHLDIPHGDHEAIVGPSGIGKSTLAALFAGVLVPDGGVVEIADTSLHLRRDRCGLVTMVPQEAYVFAGSLRDNLTYLRPSASDEERVRPGLPPRLGGCRLPWGYLENRPLLRAYHALAIHRINTRRSARLKEGPRSLAPLG